MYRLLLVDDEKIERNGILFLMRQLHLQLQVTEAANGKEALEYLSKNPVDILLTDVKMPFMDGITLLEHVSKQYPDMKKIIFSGYSEFEYARKAMHLGVKDYILKPVDPQEFEKTIQKVITELEESKIEKERKEESISFLKEHILFSLINGSRKEELLDKTKYMDLSFLKSYRRMILLETNSDFFGKADVTSLYEWLEQAEISFQYLNLNLQQSVVFLENEKEDSYYIELAQWLCDRIEKEYQEKCYIAVSDPMTEASDLYEVFESLEKRMENKFYQSGQTVFGPAESDGENVLVQIDDDTLMKQMKQDMKMKDIDSLREHFNGLCNKYRNRKNFSHIYIKFIFSNLLKDFYENTPNHKEQELNDEIDRLYRAEGFDTVMEILEKNLDRLSETFGQNPQMLHREIESVKDYIYEHYSEEIGVDLLAQKVYMAPSYLSHIFKKETGQNLSKFIKAYRMEKAKEMLEETHEKIVQISYAVGYPNVSYFCQSFREFYGVSPQKFRNTGEEG